MKLLYDFFPIALFFIAYKTMGIYSATLVLIVATMAQVGFGYYRHRKIERMQLATLALIIVFGGLTILLKDKGIIMWKPTLVNWAFAAVFLATSLFSAKPVIQHLLGSQLDLPKKVWTKLNLLWIGFFLISGAINIYFVRDFQNAELDLINAAPSMEAVSIDNLNCEKDFSPELQQLCETAKNKEEIWVDFKLFGMIGLTLIFIIIQGLYLYRFIAPQSGESENKTSDA